MAGYGNIPTKKQQIRKQATPGCPWAVILGVRRKDPKAPPRWRVLSCHRKLSTARAALAKNRSPGRGRFELYNVNTGHVADGYGSVR